MTKMTTKLLPLSYLLPAEGAVYVLDSHYINRPAFLIEEYKPAGPGLLELLCFIFGTRVCLLQTCHSHDFSLKYTVDD